MALYGDNFTTRSGNEVVRYISWHWRHLGYPPSLRNIGRAIGINSPSTVLQVIKDLEVQGKIIRDPYSRSIRVVNGAVPELCEHDYRVEKQNGEILTVVCIACARKTEVEYRPEPTQPSTWLRYVGQ